MESPAAARRRCEIELEFVQCLANPSYLHYLALAGYLQRPEFLRYLRYLNYWRQPQYAKLIVYPQCLYFLELLQDAEFRDALLDPDAVRFVAEKQEAHWRTFRHEGADADADADADAGRP